MKHLVYFFIGFLIVCFSSTKSYAQSNSDSFSTKPKKGPNIYSSKPPKGGSKSKLYGHSVSKKKTRNKSKSSFSSTKRRYKSLNAKSSKGDSGFSGSSSGRKSSKGRKKQK